MKTKIRLYTFYFSIGLIVPIISCDSSKQAQTTHSDKPNIVLIVADDLGYDFLGCYGDSLGNTPNLDRLAQNGVKFNSFYVNSPVCSPSRASMLTGRYPQKTGVETVIKPGRKGMSPQVHTLAEQLKLQGYHTGIIGKWHLGYQQEEHPLAQGFDHFFGLLSGHADYISHYRNDGEYDLWLGKKPVHPKGHLTEIFTQQAIQFIGNRKRPFFLYLPYMAPHTPYLLTEDTPVFEKEGKKREDTRRGDIDAYRKLISLLDENIGELINELEKTGEFENTIIWFASDNGEPIQIHDEYNPSHLGAKGLLLESGIKVPSILFWKNHLQHQEVSVPITGMDIFPTLLKLSDTLSSYQDFDGQSFDPLLLGHAESLPERKLFWKLQDAYAIRDNTWKAIFLSPGNLKKNRFRYYFGENWAPSQKDSILNLEEVAFLYDLEKDPGEKNDLAKTQPEYLGNLKEQLLQWEKTLTSPQE